MDTTAVVTFDGMVHPDLSISIYIYLYLYDARMIQVMAGTTQDGSRDYRTQSGPWNPDTCNIIRMCEYPENHLMIIMSGDVADGTQMIDRSISCIMPTQRALDTELYL